MNRAELKSRATRAQDHEGATAVEYAIMVALIAAVVIVAVIILGTQTSSEFDCVREELVTEGASTCT